jgi:hypothetical protein
MILLCAMISRWVLGVFFGLIFVSCSNKYHAYRSQYAFASVDGKPVYEDLDYWAAHPWKWDPSDSVPAPLQHEIRDTLADVFFLYPTTYTKRRFREANAPIDDPYTNAKTDYTSLLYQASVFNQQSRVFAPRYRQGHIRNFFKKDKAAAAEAFELAYADIRTAFLYYMEHWNNGRPVIIAAHSQGSYLGERLLKEFFEDKPLQKQLVVAYMIGWPVPQNYFSSLQMCEDSLQTGCICSWRTVRTGFVPHYLKGIQDSSYVTNPLTWTTGNEYAPRELNKGSVLTDFNKIYAGTTDAQVSGGLLYVRKPKFPGSFFYFTRNYHIADINLYYINIRENVRQRINSFLQN